MKRIAFATLAFACTVIFSRRGAEASETQSLCEPVSHKVHEEHKDFVAVADFVRDNSPVARALAPFIESGELPGAISILQKPGAEDVVLAGWADVSNRVPMSLDATFMQCSQTKGFCGVTVAILVEEGKLSLDDPVSLYLPAFSNLCVSVKGEDGTVSSRPAANILTVRMVMNHTGGFPFETRTKEKAGWHHASLADTVAEAAATPLLFEPGTSEKYSNTGIDIGAAIVEAVSGMPWQEFLQKRVLDPLGMAETTFWPTDEQLARRIKMYKPRRDAPAVEIPCHHWMPPPWNGPEVYPSAGAGLWTTARDQLKFYRMLMNLGLADNGNRILKEETVKNLLAASTRRKGRSGYSLGLNVADDGWFGHGGAWGTNCMVNWKDRKLALWVVQQTGSPRPWDAVKDRAKNEFFQAPAATGDAYTGRLE